MAAEFSVDWESKIRAAVAEALGESDWKVEISPVFGTVTPDLYVTDPSGEASYVVEIKSGDNATHAGSVAQVAAFRDAAASSQGGAPEAVLLVVGDNEDEMGRLGEDFGVSVVESGSSDVGVVVDALKKSLSLE
jgi:hypothetical protein